MSLIPSMEDSPAALMGSLGQLEWKETAEAHVLKAEVGGLRREEVKVEVEDGRVLQVSGERNIQIQDHNDASHTLHRTTSKFKRSFTLPANAKLDHLKASIENGLLTVTVPKITHSMPIHNS
ncbi:18.1 kDa class I heat shock protein-like [Cajanus cajan]|uniref:18.1 kDa class I heat shock protein-like n=1 Tax=Cajanus cajan TaxID=3821 RepID=UPI0010FAFCB3|nr:18.1 kDa class I heat shock protein-like [Cajanus cajan]